MIALANETVLLLEQVSEHVGNPLIQGVTTGFVKWVGERVFAGKKSAKEKLDSIQAGNPSQQTITELKAQLEMVLEDNDQLQQELAAQLKEVKSELQKQGITLGDVKITNSKNVVTGSTLTANNGGNIHVGDNN